MKRTKLFLTAAAVLIITALSMNSYAQWTFVGSIIGAGSYPAMCVYSSTGAVVFGGPNGQPKVFKTTNGGANWTDVTGNMSPGVELDAGWTWDGITMFAGDEGSAGGAGGNAKVWKTTNGGTTWTNILSTGGALGFINGIVFARSAPLVGIVQSDPPAGTTTPYWIAKTTDGGGTWLIQSPTHTGNEASANYSPMIIDNSFYAFGLNAAPERVAITTDAGLTWNYRAIGTFTGSNGFIPAVTFSEDKIRGFAGPNAAALNIAKTINGGVGWSSQPTCSGVSGGYCNVRWIWGTDIVYRTGESGAAGVVCRSTNAGSTWSQMSTNGLTGIRHFEYFKATVSPTDPIYLMAICTDGSVLAYRDPPLGIDPNNNSVPTEYRLEQNYPNPFNPTTTVKYSLPFSSHVTLKVYDLIGNEVMSVIIGYQTAGNYVEYIDASSLASGVYLYKLTAGDFTDSKKMAVVK